LKEKEGEEKDWSLGNKVRGFDLKEEIVKDVEL